MSEDSNWWRRKPNNQSPQNEEIKLNYISGVVDNSELYRLKKIVFRVSKGMVYPVYVPLDRHVDLKKQIQEISTTGEIIFWKAEPKILIKIHL